MPRGIPERIFFRKKAARSCWTSIHLHHFTVHPVNDAVRRNLRPEVLQISEKAVPLRPVISFSVINYVVSMRHPRASGDVSFFLFILVAINNR